MTISNILGYVFDGAVVAAVISFIIFMIKRHDEKEGEIKQVNDTLKEIKDQAKSDKEESDKRFKILEKDIVRTQLLTLMYNYEPEDEHELMQVAEHYFVDLKANWYMTGLFNRFLEKKGIGKPDWFKTE